VVAAGKSAAPAAGNGGAPSFRIELRLEAPSYDRLKAALVNTAGTRAFEGSVAGLLSGIRARWLGENLRYRETTWRSDVLAARLRNLLLNAGYLLGGSDCHLENLIARNGELILIDAETALHPELSSVSNCDLALGSVWPWDSVARTGLLPRWSFGPDGMAAFDVSALGALDDRLGVFEEPRWRHINSDLMARGVEADPAGAAQRRERLDVDALAQGFTAMYRHLLEHRAALSDSPAFRDLGKVRARLVARATRQYGAYLQSSLVGDLFRDAAARRASLEGLPILGNLDDPLWTALRNAEIGALERMDLPRFTVSTDGGDVDTGDGLLRAPPGLRAGFADAVSRFDRLGEADLARQIAIIRGSFAAIRVRTIDPVAEPMPFPDHIVAPSRRRILDAAIGLADDLAASALPTQDGGVHWLDLRRHERVECYSLQRAGFDLYDGNAGQLVTQFYGVAAVFLYCAVGTYIILKVIDMMVGLRVKRDVEVEGLDINLHGETVHA